MRRAVGFGMLAVAVWIGFLLLGHGMLSAHADNAPAVAQTTPAAYVPAADEMAARAPEYAIVEACGKPARVWVTRSGSGKFESDVRHFWYPRVPAEVLTMATPHDDKEQMRYWTFYGASPTLKGDALYDAANLKKKMPCMARWADALMASAK